MITTRIVFSLLFLVSVISASRSDGFGKTWKPPYYKGCWKGYCWQYCTPNFPWSPKLIQEYGKYSAADWCYTTNDDERNYQECTSDSECHGLGCAGACTWMSWGK